MSYTNTMLDDVKLILGYSTNAFDSILQTYIDGAKADLKMVGILEDKIVESDPLIYSAIVSYVLAMIDTYEYRELSANAYHLQKEQLRRYTEYTTVSEV